MPSIVEGRLRFDFPAGCNASKFDQWAFYRNQFMRLANANVVCNSCNGVIYCPACNAKKLAGTKGIDIIATFGRTDCWCIEIKDYRLSRTTNFAFLADVVALKVRDTHACLVAARLNANDADEKARARTALRCRMHVVLHLESPATHNPLLTPQMQRASVLQRLKQLLKAVDPHPKVVCMADMPGVPWEVSHA